MEAFEKNQKAKSGKAQPLPLDLQGNENKSYIEALCYLLSIIVIDSKKKDEKDPSSQIIMK